MLRRGGGGAYESCLLEAKTPPFLRREQALQIQDPTHRSSSTPNTVAMTITNVLF